MVVLVGALLLAVGSTLVVGSPAQADSVRSQEWYLDALQVPAAQAISQGDGVTVAVLDSGVAANQPDLTGSVLPGVDAVSGSGTGARDEDGHGTSIAAVIAGHGHGPGNADGVLGIAPRAKILPIKMLHGKAVSQLTPDIVVRAIDAAVASGAKVINASFGAEVDEPIRQAILRALDHDVVFVAAVGNTGTTTDIFGTHPNEIEAPAFFPGVMAICGTDRKGNHAAVSLTAPANGLVPLALCAPAVDSVVANPDGTYATGISGTSISSAIVSGVAALIRAKYPTMPAYEVAHRLTATATPKGDPRVYGSGLVNPVAALTADVPPTASPSPWISHSPTPPAPTTSAPGSGASAATGKSSRAVGPAVIAVAAVVVVLLGAGVWIAIQRRRRPG